MRFRIFTGQRDGRPDRQMAFDIDGQVYQLKFLRDMFHPLKVQRLEDVTGRSLGLAVVSHETPICTSPLEDPVAIYNAAVKTLPSLTPA